MAILSLNTAMDGIGVGFYDPASDTLLSKHMETVRGQAAHLVPMVQDVLAEAGAAFADLSAVVCVIGPGSFTGLRLCLSAAKSFGLALDIPVYGITSLQALALQYGDVCMVLVETKRKDFYVQAFDEGGAAVSVAQSMEEEGVRALHDGRAVIGDAAERFGFETECKAIDAGFLAKLYVEAPEWFTDVIEPLYLRGADVSMPKRVQRILE